MSQHIQNIDMLSQLYSKDTKNEFEKEKLTQNEGSREICVTKQKEQISPKSWA